MPYLEFPKFVTRGDDALLVIDAAEQAAAEANGWTVPPANIPVDPDVPAIPALAFPFLLYGQNGATLRVDCDAALTAAQAEGWSIHATGVTPGTGPTLADEIPSATRKRK